MDELVYSTDGHSVASILGTLLVIWDIQTGGVAKEIEHGSAYNVALAWSLNGSTIGIISHEDWHASDQTVCIYDVGSGMMHSPGTLPSTDTPDLWAYDTSFRAMTAAQGDEGLIIDIFEVGPILTKIESFRIGSLRGHLQVGSFSHSTYRISISVGDSDFVFDIRNSHCLLSPKHLRSHCFSSDGSLFAGISTSAVCIWKYTSDGYTPWREFSLQFQASSFFYRSLQFSPTSSSVLARSDKILRLWRLDGPPIVAHPDYRMLPLITLSRCGSYVAVSHWENDIVTITNLVSQAPLHTINTGMVMDSLVLTGNVLLVFGSTTIAAWRLTEEGTVDGVFVDRGAGRGDSIWTLSLPSSLCDELVFSFGDQTVTIRLNGIVVHVYHTETGEVLDPTQTLLYHHDYSFKDTLRGLHHPHYHDIDPVSIMQTGWVKGPEGKLGLWIPGEWKTSLDEAISSDDRKTLRLDLIGCETILIKF